MKATNPKAALIVIDRSDSSQVHRFRKYFPGYTLDICLDSVSLYTKVRMACARIGATKVLCCQYSLLCKLVKDHDPEAKAPSENDYAGSTFYIPATPDYPQIQVLICPKPKAFLYTPPLDWLMARWTQKLTNPNFPVFPKLDWQMLEPHTIDAFYGEAKGALMIAVDIETTKAKVHPKLVENDPKELRGIWTLAKKSKTSKKKEYIPIAPIITMVGYACLFQRPNGEFYSKTGVLYIRSMVDVEYMRKFNTLPAPKVLQNGGYDCTYFLRYQAPMVNYVYDTFVGMHAWLAELSRNLSFITSLFDRDHVYWKDESERAAAHYNAKDCHNTLWSWIHMVDQWPQWAADNYTENFRMQFPCIQCGMEGWLVDPDERQRIHIANLQEIHRLQKRLDTIVTPGLNVNSPKQMLKLMHGLGYTKAKNTDDVALQDFSDAHPLYSVIAEIISEIRTLRKANSTYIETPLLAGRLLYELNPAGTDTGRMNSKASNLWCGTQIQNQPPYAKSMYIADPGWELNSLDNAQSESRCTAYISEDKALMAAVESPLDFHKVNATRFFGMPYVEITKEVRNTGKRVNHGANYNMSPPMLLRTMGRKAVIKAAKLLKLPSRMGLLDICTYLLECFDNAYPDVRGKYYREVIQEIQTTGLLRGALGWVRKCFGNPTNSKRELNLYVAHPPQSLSVKIINITFFEVWLEFQIKQNKIRLKAQVHDDIIYMTKPVDTIDVGAKVSAMMARPTIVRGRSMIIPNDPVLGKPSWAALKED